MHAMRMRFVYHGSILDAPQICNRCVRALWCMRSSDCCSGAPAAPADWYHVFFAYQKSSVLPPVRRAIGKGPYVDADCATSANGAIERDSDRPEGLSPPGVLPSRTARPIRPACKIGFFGQLARSMGLRPSRGRTLLPLLPSQPTCVSG